MKLILTCLVCALATMVFVAQSGCNKSSIGQTASSETMVRTETSAIGPIKDLPEKANIEWSGQQLAVSKTINLERGTMKQVAGAWAIEVSKNGQVSDRVIPIKLDVKYQVEGLDVIFSGYAGYPPPNVRMAGSPFELVTIKKAPAKQAIQGNPKMEIATFGAGCFWCVEAVFQDLEGVTSVKSGYCNGTVENPSYDAVCSGTTGHAEVCRIEYDPTKIGFKDLLEVFWQTHDPTTLNQQGADRGTQYRSGVFYHSEEQRLLAEKFKKKLNDENVFRRPVVTEISKVANYYEAEEKHQNFYKNNPNYGYCRAVIVPKMEKFKKAFGHKLKGAQPAAQKSPSDK